jgi:hypothetical protein
MDAEQREYPAKASEWDQSYMRRLGRYKHESHEQARLEHLARSGRERIVYSVAMTLAGTYWRQPEADDDPSPLYERARRLGLLTC